MGIKTNVAAAGLSVLLSACSGLPQKTETTPPPSPNPTENKVSVEDVLKSSPFSVKKDKGCIIVVDPTKPDDKPICLKQNETSLDLDN